MVCKKCGIEISEEAKLCPACMVRSEVSAVPFWVTMVVLLAWEMATAVWGAEQIDGLTWLTFAMIAAGFCLAAALTAARVINARRMGVMPCLSILAAYLLWYAFHAVSLFGFARSGAGVYDSIVSVLPLCSVVTAAPLWPWAAVIFAGLAKTGKIKPNGVTVLLCGIVLCAVSVGGFMYLRTVPEFLQAHAGTYVISRLGGQWLLRLGCISAVLAWGCGKARGLWTAAVLFGAPVFAGGVMLLAGRGYAIETVLYAVLAVYVGFALVGLELAAMKRGSVRP